MALLLAAAVTRSKGAIPKFEVSLELKSELAAGGNRKTQKTSIISLGLEVFFSNELPCFCTKKKKTSKKKRSKRKDSIMSSIRRNAAF